MTNFTINQEINFVQYGTVFNGTITMTGLSNGHCLVVKVGTSETIIDVDDIVGPCSALVKFVMNGVERINELCSPKEAWNYVDNVITKNGWDFKDVTMGTLY